MTILKHTKIIQFRENLKEIYDFLEKPIILRHNHYYIVNNSYILKECDFIIKDLITKDFFIIRPELFRFMFEDNK